MPQTGSHQSLVLCATLESSNSACHKPVGCTNSCAADCHQASTHQRSRQEQQGLPPPPPPGAGTCLAAIRPIRPRWGWGAGRWLRAGVAAMGQLGAAALGPARGADPPNRTCLRVRHQHCAIRQTFQQPTATGECCLVTGTIRSPLAVWAAWSSGDLTWPGSHACSVCRNGEMQPGSK